MSFRNEEWKKVKFDFEITNDFRLEISNNGRARTFTKIADGKILKGSNLTGYKVLHLKLFKPRTAAEQKRFEYLKLQISMMYKLLAPIKVKLKTNQKHNKIYFEYRKKVAEGTKLILTLKENLKKLRREDEKQRTINYSPLVHRLVAQSFCRKPSINYSIVGHLDYNKLNNRSENLKWMTMEENIFHQQNSPKVLAEYKKKAGRRPTKSKSFKLTETRVMLLKKLMNKGTRLKTLSKQFGVTEMQVLRIKSGENWGDVKAAN